MVINVSKKEKNKPGMGDTRIVKRFLFLPTPNIFGDKRAIFENRSVLQVYDDLDGMLRWRNLYFIDTEI